MRCREVIQAEWARAHTAELANAESYSECQSDHFSCQKHLFLYFLQQVTLHSCFQLSFARGEALEKGRGVFLHGSQTLILMHKAIAIPPCKPRNLGSRLCHFLFCCSLVQKPFSFCNSFLLSFL
jgi:hypothetical protein